MTKHIPRQLFFLLTSWLLAVTLECLLIPAEARVMTGLAGLRAMSLPRVLCITVGGMLLWNLIPRYRINRRDARWLLVYIFVAYATVCVVNSFSWAFAVACALMLALLIGYAVRGWEHTPSPAMSAIPVQREEKRWFLLTLAAALLFAVFVSAWTVARVRSFSTPTFDFGIFSQMFHNMKETGIPMTTVERDGPLSHFAVHVSPIYYLMLPFYWLVPRPETLQVLQAAVLASAVFPLWLIGKRHGLSPKLRLLVCVLLLLYPSYAGGTSYDLHENCFLTPLILWLLYAMDAKNIPLMGIAALLTFTVKEDAAVYVAIAALYLLLRALLHRDTRGAITGCALLVLSIAWFLAVTRYLAQSGDGVMTYRYSNFLYDDSGSLLTVIKAVLMSPLKALYECVDAEKLSFIGFTLVPLVGLPFATRRYERLVLLIPYLLVNLMSDYQYQHSILFQYTFGATACLFYLSVVNLAELKIAWNKCAIAGVAVAIALGCFYTEIVPLAERYVRYSAENSDYFDEQRAVLDTIPDDATVAATTFYTTYLSDRAVLYDIHYGSTEHVLSCEYIAVKAGESGAFSQYAVGGKNGRDNFLALIEENGYTLISDPAGEALIYHRETED